MDARWNKLSSCKIPDHYLKKQKKILNFLELWYTLAEKKEKKGETRSKDLKSCEKN